MKLRKFIESRFLIDEPKTGKLVPFIFRTIQNKYYDELVRDYDIENKGLNGCIRDVIVKARRQGFSSLILALFAADDILSENPTETTVISYKDDATQVFRKRYRNFILSWYAIKAGNGVVAIQGNPSILESYSKQVFSKDEDGNYELAHNRAHFYCGTASAKVGGRGGVLHKLLFSEAAYYPDREQMKAREIVEGTMRQVDIGAGWVFVESTGKFGTYFEKMWEAAVSKTSRFIARFFSWRDYYSEEDYKLIASEFVDKRILKQEYPETPEEAFIAGGNNFFDIEKLKKLKTREPKEKVGDWSYYAEYAPGHRYALGCDVSEGVGRHNSTIAIWDYDAKITVGDVTVHRPETVATYANNKIAPDMFAYEIKNGGTKYGNCLAAVERNNHGFATLSKLKEIYYNIYKEPLTDRLGWHTNMSSKPKMLHEFNQAVNEELINLPEEQLIREMKSFPSQDLNTINRDEDEDETHWDRVIAVAIGWQMRSLAVASAINTITDDARVEGEFDKHALFNSF